MITSIQIESFRGIRSGELTDLKPLTVLTGTNACGKSAVLDALLIGASPSPGEAVIRAVQRHPITKDGARWLVHAGAKAADIAVRFDGGDAVRSLRLTVSVPRVTIAHQYLARFHPHPPTTVVDFQSESAPVITRDIPEYDFETGTWGELEARMHAGSGEVRLSDPGLPAALHPLYSTTVRLGYEEDVLELLRAIVPDVEGLRILTESDDTPALYLTKAGGAVPVSLSGDGIQAFLQLALEIAAAPGELVLVEEPEVYQHPAAIRRTARVLRESARRGVQTVVTTHSLDLIDFLVNEANEHDRADTALYILRLSDGELRASRFSGEEMAYARQQAETDLR